MSVNLNLNGIHQLDLNFGGTTTAAITAPGVVTVTNTPASGGSVTSVGLTVPSRQTVTGSPVTSSGTLAVSDNNQPANEVFAGPSSGSAATPAFRTLVPADLPVATVSALGAVKPDGTTITISAGVISGATSGITQLTGDVTAGPGSGSVAASVVKVNGAAVPASHAYVGTNSSSQIIAATTPLLPANNLSDVASTTTARTNLGLGTMATQNATAVAITGGTIEGTGVTVGIGTATPQAPLHVAGTTNVMRFDNAGILNNPNFWLTQNAYFDGTWHRITSGSPVAGFNFSQSSGLLSFVSDTSTTGTPAPSTIATLSETGAFTGNNLAIASGGGGSLTFQDGTTQSTAATVPSGTTNKVYATPNGSTGAATLRALVPADLPVATTSALGAVKPDGTTITISAGVISSTGGGGGYSLGGTVSSSNVTLGIGAGTGATIGTVGGLDGTHQVSFTAGSGATAPDDLWTFNFTTSRGHTTYPVVTGSIPVLVASSSATSYIVSSIGTAPTNGVLYTFNVSCP